MKNRETGLAALRRWSLGVAASLGLSVPLYAQARRPTGPESSLTAGPSPYALAERGTGFSAHAGLGFRVTRRVLILEPGLGFFIYRNPFKVRTSWFFPELSAQAELRPGGLRPFIGAGAGAGVESLPGSDRWKGTLHAVAGLRLRLGRTWGARAEVRLRGVHARGHTIDIGAGIFTGIM